MHTFMKSLYESLFSVSGGSRSELNNNIKNATIKNIIDTLNNTHDILLDSRNVMLDENNIDIQDPGILIIAPPSSRHIRNIWMKFKQPMNDILSSYDIKKIKLGPTLSQARADIILNNDISGYNVIGNLQEYDFNNWDAHVSSKDKGFNGTTFTADNLIDFTTYYGDNSVKFNCKTLVLNSFLVGSEVVKYKSGCFGGKVENLIYFMPSMRTVDNMKFHLDAIMGTNMDKNEMDQYITSNALSNIGVVGWIDEYNLNVDDIRKRLGIENIQAQRAQIAIPIAVSSRRTTWPRMIIFDLGGPNIAIYTLDKTGEKQWWKQYNALIK